MLGSRSSGMLQFDMVSMVSVVSSPSDTCWMVVWCTSTEWPCLLCLPKPFSETPYTCLVQSELNQPNSPSEQHVNRQLRAAFEITTGAVGAQPIQSI